MRIITFDSEIKEIENEIIEFLKQSQLFLGERSSTAEILSYFITRKDLTQAKLKELTGLSRGTISQEIQYLTKRGIIHEKENTNIKAKVYTMESVITGFIKSFLYAVKDYLKYKEKFLQMKKELERQKEQLQKFENFDRLYQLIMLFLKAFPLVEEIIEMLQKKLPN
jgi:DNA-binding transcriptional regulator GbsR (MarR family)